MAHRAMPRNALPNQLESAFISVSSVWLAPLAQGITFDL